MMDELQKPLVILVNKSIADEGMRKGMVEVAQRREDAKFSAITKCRLLEKGLDFQQAESFASYAAAQNAPSASEIMKAVRKAMKTVRRNSRTNGSGISPSDMQIRHISAQVDSIFQMQQAVLSLSYLNTGLLLANTAVDAAGFALICDKLNVLEDKVDHMAAQIGNIANGQKNEKIGKCQQYIVKYISMASEIQDGDEIDIHRIQDLLDGMYSFLLEMMRNLFDGVFETELILDMVFTLLPAYTVLLEKFTQEYYFKKRRLPSTYFMLMRIYEVMRSEKTVSSLEDYYFLRQEKSSIETLDIINAQSLLLINEKTQIEDTVKLLEVLETRDNFERFDHALEELAEKKAAVFITDQENRQRESAAKQEAARIEKPEDNSDVSAQLHAKYDIPIE